MVLSSNISSEDTDKILAAVIVCYPPQEVTANSASGYCCTRWQKGWQVEELAAARFARACLSASELTVRWVTLHFRKQGEQQIV